MLSVNSGMTDYRDFLTRFGPYASDNGIPWAVIGSHAMVAHAKAAGIEPRRAANDLDLIAILPRPLDHDVRAWLGGRSMWVYDGDELGAIHVRCNDGKQVDIFTKRDLSEIGPSLAAEVLGFSCRVVCPEDAWRALERWAVDTRDPRNVKHYAQEKYQEDAAWYRNVLKVPDRQSRS